MNEFYRSQTGLVPTVLLLAVLSAAARPAPPALGHDETSSGFGSYAHNYYLSQHEASGDPIGVSLTDIDLYCSPEPESGWNLLASVLLKDSRPIDAVERAALEECFWAA